MANFRKSACTGRRHGKFSDLGRNPMHSETGAKRASPWPIFGNRLSQGVAMANFQILALIFIFIYIYTYIITMPLQTGSDRASPWPIFGNLLAQGPCTAKPRRGYPPPTPAFASLCLHRLKVQIIIFQLEASDLIFEACMKP